MNKNCVQCGKTFSFRNSHSERAKYCSLECRYISQKSRFKDVTGQKFNKLTALVRIRSKRKNNRTMDSIWLWLCDCGNEKEIALNYVQNGNTKSCGCLFKSMNRTKDITGQRFGNLVAIKKTRVENQSAFWLLVCDCGNECESVIGNLTSGNRKTCGCRMSSKGKNAYNWSGGKKIDSAGYVYLYKPEYPNATRKGYIAEHRFVMEMKIGRYLTRKEEVHHLNGIKDDNRPDNLELWSGSHPRGARVKDLVKFAREILAEYGGLFPE